MLLATISATDPSFLTVALMTALLTLKEVVKLLSKRNEPVAGPSVATDIKPAPITTNVNTNSAGTNGNGNFYTLFHVEKTLDRFSDFLETFSKAQNELIVGIKCQTRILENIEAGQKHQVDKFNDLITVLQKDGTNGSHAYPTK